MKQEDFDDLLKEVIEDVEKVLGNKADEYAFGDRLSNFKTAAALQGCTPERALLGMLTKHTVSIVDFVKELDNGGRPRKLAAWKEKITDAINYNILLLALVTERSVQATSNKR